MATGRRDPRLYAIELERALNPPNNNTSNAIVSRATVALDRLDGTMVGDPANLAISEDRRTVCVVNHHGSIDNNEYTQHGGRGGIAVLNLSKIINPHNDNTAAALERHIDSGSFGAVGLIPWKDLFIIGNAESHLMEDGGNRITFVDRRTGSLRSQVELALGQPNHPCPVFPVPFTSPTPEIARIPTQIGPWGIAASPNGRWIVAANRESQQLAFEGNTISIIDVDLARVADPRAITADGRYAVISGGARTAPGGGTVSVIDLQTRAVVGTVTGVGIDPYGLAVVKTR